MRITYRIPRAALLCGLFLCSVLQADAQSVGDKMNAAIKRVYGESAQATVASVALSDAQLTAIRNASGLGYARTATYYSVSVGGRRVGYGIIDEVKGKVKMITYAVFVDPALNIKDLEVLAYREPYGGEIAYEAFRRQFRGKGVRDTYRIGADLRNISGATISTNAIAAGTRRVMAVLNELRTAGALR